MNLPSSSGTKMHSEPPTPNPKIRTLTLEDGCIRIQVGEYVGTVSSMHLVEVKINQLMSAWKSRHQAGGINQRSEI
jgi:hypothetical protein